MSKSFVKYGKGLKLVQMKLTTKRSKLALRAFKNFFAFVRIQIRMPQTKAFH